MPTDPVRFVSFVNFVVKKSGAPANKFRKIKMKKINLKTQHLFRCVALSLVLPLFLSGCGNSDTEAAPVVEVTDISPANPVENPSIDTRKLPPDTPPVFPGEDILLKHPETPELPFGIRKVKPEQRTIEKQPNT